MLVITFYTFMVVSAGVASFFRDAGFWVALSGTLAPLLALYGGVGMKGSFHGTDKAQKLAGVGMGIVFLVVASLWASYAGFTITIYGVTLGAGLWVLLGFVIGFLCTTKTLALKWKDEDRVATCISTMNGIFQRGKSVADIWRQILDCIEARRKILESESKRLKDQGQTMGVEQLLAIIEYIVDVINKAVRKYADRETAPKILSQITGDIGAMVSGSVPRSAATMRLLA